MGKLKLTDLSVWPTYFDTLIRWFMYILIFWMPYSTAVVESCIVTGLVFWSLKRMCQFRLEFKSGRSMRENLISLLRCFKPVANRLAVPILFFLGFCAISVFLSEDTPRALRGFLTKTCEWFVVYCLIIEVFKEKKHVFVAVGILIFTCASTALDSFYQYYFTHKDIFNGRIIEPGARATGPFKAPTGLAGIFTIVIPITVAFFLGKQQSIAKRLGWFVLVLIMGWSLYLSFSRGAILSVFLSGLFILFVLFYFCYRRKVKAYLIMTMAAIAIILASQVAMSGHERFGFLSRGTANFRIIIWEGTFNMITDKPYFGHGLNTFMGKFQKYRRRKVERYYRDIMYSIDHPTYAHNCYLQIWAEAGIFSLLSFLWIIRNFIGSSVASIVLFYKKRRDLYGLSVGMLAGIFAFLMHSFFDTNFYSIQLSAYLWYMIGLQMVLNRFSQQNEGVKYAKA